MLSHLIFFYVPIKIMFNPSLPRSRKINLLWNDFDSKNCPRKKFLVSPVSLKVISKYILVNRIAVVVDIVAVAIAIGIIMVIMMGTIILTMASTNHIVLY